MVAWRGRMVRASLAKAGDIQQYDEHQPYEYDHRFAQIYSPWPLPAYVAAQSGLRLFADHVITELLAPRAGVSREQCNGDDRSARKNDGSNDRERGHAGMVAWW